jgi:hypothetical protein
MNDEKLPVYVTDGDTLVSELFKKVRLVRPERTLADEVVDFGRRRRWPLSKKPYSGTIEGTVRHGVLEYRALQPDDTIPAAVQERLDAIRAEFAVKQVLIGHETEPTSVDKFEAALVRVAEATKTTVRAVLAVVGLALVVITAISAIAAVVAAGVLTVGTATVAVAADPELIVVLDDPEEDGPWVLCGRWYD